MKRQRTELESWLWGEILLAGLLGASLALFLTNRALRAEYDLPELRLVLQTAMALAGVLVALLAAVRFSVEGRRLDLLLGAGFLTSSLSTILFAIGPQLGGGRLRTSEAWAWLVGSILGQALVALAPLSRGRSPRRRQAIAASVVGAGAALAAAWWVLDSVGAPAAPAGPTGSLRQPLLLTVVLAIQAMVNLIAVVGWGQRFRSTGDDLARWFSLGFTLLLFASLQLVFQPFLASTYVSYSDFLSVVAFALILVGAWRAIRFAEFGRAVAEERARVAREIHDGLAQYLFAVSTHASMLQGDAAPPETVARLKEAAALAQQEARFAVLALSSAGGTAPFDAALMRYIEFMTVDGALEVELDIDGSIRLAPDEQIEIFRIVQEGLANVRTHANATRVKVTIGQRGFGERYVAIHDNGAGFEGDDAGAGQGLKNMRLRAQSIEGGFSVHSTPGRGTALEVVLRT